MAAGRLLGFVPNAPDHVAEKERAAWDASTLAEVRDLGIGVETLDLRHYFGRTSALKRKLQQLVGV